MTSKVVNTKGKSSTVVVNTMPKPAKPPKPATDPTEPPATDTPQPGQEAKPDGVV